MNSFKLVVDARPISITTIASFYEAELADAGFPTGGTYAELSEFLRQSPHIERDDSGPIVVYRPKND